MKKWGIDQLNYYIYSGFKGVLKLARLPLSYLHTLKLCYKLLIQIARLSCNGF
jgi:hypothetical protein